MILLIMYENVKLVCESLYIINNNNNNKSLFQNLSP